MTVKCFTGPRDESIYTNCITQLEPHRLLDYTKSTQTSAYATFGSDPDGYTEIKARAKDTSTTSFEVGMTYIGTAKEFWVKTFAAIVAAGAALVCVADGQVAPSGYTIATRKHVTDPGVDGVYIIPSAGWGGLHGNAIATRVTTYTYVEMDTTTAGTVIFVTDEGRYYVWTGTAWTLAKVVGYAVSIAAAGDLVAVFNTKMLHKQTRDSLPLFNSAPFIVGQSASESDADNTVTVSDDRVLSTDICIGILNAAANAVYLRSAICTSKTITFTLSGNGGAGTVVNYAVFRALS